MKNALCFLLLASSLGGCSTAEKSKLTGSESARAPAANDWDKLSCNVSVTDLQNGPELMTNSPILYRD
jgi:hypothetical protein